jgi:hypothetical protein
MTTPKTGSPEWAASQASPDVTVNEALRRIEAGTGPPRIVDRDLTSPPGSCADGATYIVAGPSPTGAWAGHDGDLAIAVGVDAASGWYFIEPEEWLVVACQDEDVLLRFSNATSPGSWVTYTAAAGAIDLDDLTDVDVPSPSDGQVLTYDTDSPAGWKAMAPSTGVTTLDGLTDVDTTGVVDGYILVYEDSPAGWRAVPRRLGQFWYDQVACSDETTALETGVLSTWRQIGTVVVSEVRASLTTAEADGLIVVDIRLGGVSILSSPIIIDQGALTSVGSSPQAVISTNVIPDNSEMSVEVLSTGGASPVTAAGLKVQFLGAFLAP